VTVAPWARWMCDPLCSTASVSRLSRSGVGHAGLVEVDRGVLADVELAAFDTRDERVDRQGPAGERGTVLAEALGG